MVDNIDPFPIARSELENRSVSAEKDAVRAERVNDMVDERQDLPLVPGHMVHLRQQSRDFAHYIWKRRNLSYLATPGFKTVLFPARVKLLVDLSPHSCSQRLAVRADRRHLND
jgi:hypothetical protein